MKQLVSPHKIYISESKTPDPKNADFISGRGVFAKEEIKKGEVIEVAPIIILDFQDFIDTKWNVMFEYYFWLDEYVVLALGYGSLYNHSQTPNAEYEINKEDKTIIFKAIKNIEKDQEILFNYSKTASKKAPLWFEK